VLAQLNASLKETLQDPGLQKQAYDMGLVLEKDPQPQALASFLHSELAKWGQVAKAAKMTAN